VNIPTFSVVIPLYNKERHVTRAMQSVFNQTYCDLELIVVDDGSTDDGARVVEAIRDHRTRLIRQANAGASAARNRGIAVARAGLVAFLDADDEWLPEHLETVKCLSEKYPECGAYATEKVVVDPDGKRTIPVHDGIPVSPWEGVIPNYFRSATSYPLCSSAVAIPRRVFDSVGQFPVGVSHGEDIDMWCRIALKYPICFSTQVGAVYHKEVDCRACVSSQQLKEYSFVKVIQDALSAGVIPPEQRWDAFEFIAFSQILVAGSNITKGNLRYARLLLRSCRGTRKHARSWRRSRLWAMFPPGWPARLKAARNAMRNLAGRRKWIGIDVSVAIPLDNEASCIARALDSGPIRKQRLHRNVKML
jgi:glycosyltransferase involved in cell wall biosynthesis